MYETCRRNRTCRLFPGHLIYAGNHTAAAHLHTTHLQPVFAGQLQTGSDVIVNTGGNVGRATVVAMRWSHDSSGVYAPITERGTIVVDDVIVSCYAEFSSHVTAHACLAPLRYAYYVSRWLFQQSAAHADAHLDGVHWYATLLRRLAETVVPRQFWWSAAWRHTVSRYDSRARCAVGVWETTHTHTHAHLSTIIALSVSCVRAAVLATMQLSTVY